MQNLTSDTNSKPVTMPKSLKWLIWANIVLVVFLPLTEFGAMFFCYGGCPLLSVPFGIIFGMGMVFFRLAFYIMVCVDLFFAFRLWKTVKTYIFIPIAILAVCFFMTILSLDTADKLVQDRFHKHFKQYEQVITTIKDATGSPKAGFVGLPSGYRYLTCFANVYVDRDPNDADDFMVEFMVGSRGFAGHTAYLYSSSGNIAKDSPMDKRWPKRTQVNDHWFRASD